MGKEEELGEGVGRDGEVGIVGRGSMKSWGSRKSWERELREERSRE